MKYWERYLLCAVFILALPHIICETIKYYHPKQDKFFEWLKLNLDYEWEEIRLKGINE